MDDPTSFIDCDPYGLVDYNGMPCFHHEPPGGNNFTDGVQDFEMTNFHNSTNNNGY